MAATRTQRYNATRVAEGHPGGLAIVEEGDLATVAATADEARFTIHERAHRRAFELADLKGWLTVRGALVDIDDRRVLLLGPPSSGKTILTLRLGLRGAAIQGDDRVLLRAGELLAVPRPLVLRADACELVPELAALGISRPGTPGVSLLDPSRDLGLAWRLRIARLDHVVALERTSGAPAWRPCPAAELLPLLAAAVAGPSKPTPELLPGFAEALRGASGHRLSVADPGIAEDALRRLAC
jgi:hypothetical protein